MTVVGLDLSTTSVGVCAEGVCWTVAPKGDLLGRCRQIADELQPTLLSADLLIVEAIPPSAKSARTLIGLATVHALVFDRLANRIGPRIVKPNQSAVKKYATGKGNADKSTVTIAATRAGSPADNSDEADAWWMWAMGEHLDGRHHVELTEYRTEVLGGLS